MTRPKFDFSASFNDQIKSSFNGNDVLREDKFLSKRVRFSISNACVSGRFEIGSVFASHELTKNLQDELGKVEKMTWSDFQNIPHDKGGWSSEREKIGKNFAWLKKKYPAFDTFGHIRINTPKAKKIFRIFCARKDDLIYLLEFDINGEINH